MQKFSSTFSLTLALDRMGGQRHVQVDLTPGRRLVTLCTVGWMGPRTGLDVCGKSSPYRNSIPGPSSPQRFAVQTTLSRAPRRNSHKYIQNFGTSSSYQFNVPYVINCFVDVVINDLHTRCNCCLYSDTVQIGKVLQRLHFSSLEYFTCFIKEAFWGGDMTTSQGHVQFLIFLRLQGSKGPKEMFFSVLQTLKNEHSSYLEK